MNKLRVAGKKITSVIAALLAALTLLPVETFAAAPVTTATGTEDTGVYWSSELPTDGDRSYHTDSKWYRLVLEKSGYSSNSVDSSGNYSDTSSSTASSWPSGTYANTNIYNSEGWIGKNKTEKMVGGTTWRFQDYSLYRNNEYSQDGMYSLYIKYAGKSKKTNEDCWYISPCDSNGDREKKLWALDCCVNQTGAFYVGSSKYALIRKQVSSGISPSFTLLTPTFEEFETSENFLYAGMATGIGTGKILADYYDNHKWIITQNSDGSWAIKSAGYVEWDWTDPDSGYTKLFEDSSGAMMNTIAAYLAEIELLKYYAAYCDYTESDSDALGQKIVEGWKKSGDENKYLTRAVVGFDKLYEDATSTEFGSEMIMPMLFLSEYAENVYITMGEYYQGTWLASYKGTSYGGNRFYNGYTSGYGTAGTYYASCAMLMESSLSAENFYKVLLARYDGKYASEGFVINTRVETTEEGTVEKKYRYYTTDELKEQIKDYYSLTPFWTPSSKESGGTFDCLYVGTPLKTQKYNQNNQAMTVDKGVTVALGAQDKNSDGVNDGAAYIGTFLEYIYQRKLESMSAPSITVEEGGTLQIDGPTYAAYGTKITVKGTLVISSGAFLVTEDAGMTSLPIGTRGIEIIIDGGTVYVSSNAILDIGYENLTLKNGGRLTNNGVFLQDTYNNDTETIYVDMKGGTIENGSSAWFISGATVTGNMRQTLLRKAGSTGSLEDIIWYLTNINDYTFEKYAGYPYETTGVSSSVSFRMFASEKENCFRNRGNALICWAMKGIGAENDGYAGTFMGSGNLYRGLDLFRLASNYYVDDSTGWSFEIHEAHMLMGGTIATPDDTMRLFYSLNGIKQVSSDIVENETGTTRAEKNNVFALRVGTGSQGTDRISSFAVTYVDTSGRENTEYINLADLKVTYNFVSKWKYCGTGENEAGSSKLKSGTDGIMSRNSFSGTLDEMSNKVYIFQTVNPLAYVKSISFQGAGSGAWTCTELNIYKVSYLYPLEEYGWRSEDWYIPFSGSLIAETALETDSTGVKSINFSWESEGIEIGTGLYQLNVYGAPETAKTLTDSSGFKYYNVSTEAKDYSTADKEYTFSITLADIEGAGIESYYNNGIDVSLAKMMGVSESTTEQDDSTSKVDDEAAVLDEDYPGYVDDDGPTGYNMPDVAVTAAADVEAVEYEEVKASDNGTKGSIDMVLSYIDTNGSARRITLPFTQSAMEWAYSAMDETSRNAPVHGIFQQGEEIVFRGMLPDYFKALEATLVYTDSSNGATIAVTAVSISDPSYTEISVKDGMLKAEYPETAVDFYCASTTDGVSVMNGQDMSISFKVWNGTESLKPQPAGSRFLVVVQTDTMSEAATKNDITVSFTYKTLSGLTASTSAYSLNMLVDDYCGYWLTSDGQDLNCAYRTAVSSGQQMYFVVDVNNLYTFTTATFSMPSADGTASEDVDEETEEYKNDAWQLGAITIYEVEEIGQRQVLLGSGISLSDISTNRTYYRDNIYGSRGAINSAKGPLMIGPGQSKTIDFEKGNVSGGGEVISENKANRVKELTYEETKQDFGFNTRRSSYTINVKVAGKSITSAEDGDCGSQNQFYFQLVFQDDEGNLKESPWVLSNQQLKSDGFRTGTTEEFMVYTNGDYGTPVQINIIPDDTSSTSDVFDKLCIDYITVSKTSGTGVCLSWKAEDVGWIDIEYKDESEEQDGRTDEELMRSFELKEAGYSVRLEFGIETAADYVDDMQFVGQVLADITYRDSSGTLKTKSNVAVVSRIAQYAERTSDLQDVNETGTDTSVSDYMFKNGYTNRFHYEFDDISSLIKIKFKIIPEEDCTWKIERVSARQVYDEGTLSYNIFNEYERYYSVTAQDLTSSSNSKAISVEASAGEQTDVTINFSSGNAIKVNLDEDEGEIDITEGETEGANDVLSITAALTDTQGIAAGTTMPVRIVYKNIYGDAYAVKATMAFDEASGVFMVPQNQLPKTPDIGVPYQVEVTGGSLAGRELEVVTVNQVRDREVVETFLFVPATGTLLEQNNPVTIVLSDSEQDEYAKRKGYTNEIQTVFLQLGSLTQKTLLTESQDLQVALVYARSDDPYDYDRISDFVSAMSCGYTVVSSGDILKLPMNVSNLGRVKSVLLKTSTAQMQINVEKGCIALEESSALTNDRLSTGWVNLPAATQVISPEGTAMSTDGNTLETALSSTTRAVPLNIEMGVEKINRTDAMLKMTLNYLDTQNATRTVVCDMAASDWSRGSKWVLAEGLKTVQYYKIEVYDKDGTNSAGVTLNGITVSWYGTDGIYTSATYTGAMALSEGTIVSNSVLDTQVTGTVTSSYQSQRIALEDNHVNADRTNYGRITLAGTGEVTVQATLAGFPGELEMYVVDSTGAKTVDTLSANAASDSISYSFALPLNTGKETAHYFLHVRSKNMPNLYESIVYIDVEPAVYIEAMVYDSTGTKLGDTLTAISGAYNDYRKFYAGDTVTVYARITNDTSMQMSSSETAGVFDAGDGETAVLNGESWMKYTLTMSDTITSATTCSFTLTSAKDTAVSYKLTFTIEPKVPKSES